MKDKYELIDSIVAQLNDLADARGLSRCVIIIEIAQKLHTLAEGLQNDDNSHAEKVHLLEKQLARPVDGKSIGGERYEIGFGGEPDANAETE